MDKGVRLAIKAVGGRQALADLLGISYQAVQQWTKIPAERVVEIEEKTGVDRTKLRPDLYRRTKAKLPRTELTYA